jgi:hypothetical protein
VRRQLHDPAGLPRISPSILQETRQTNESVWVQGRKGREKSMPVKDTEHHFPGIWTKQVTVPNLSHLNLR